MGDKQVEHNPPGHGSTHVDLSSQFIDHCVETFDCIRYTVDRFQTFTYDPINCDSGKCELKTITASIPQGVPERNKILTLAATIKASFHSLLTNVAFAHSLNSGVGVHESKVARGVGASLCGAVFEAASPSFSGVERYLQVKSVEKFRTHGNQTGQT